MVKPIAIVGVECSGKSTLALALSQALQAPLVIEQARHYLSNLGKPYAQHDLSIICELQVQAQQLAIEQATSKFVVFDTTPLVIQIWSEVVYNSCHHNISNAVLHYDKSCYLHVLPHFDIPWQADALRELPSRQQRELLFNNYKAQLQLLGVPYVIVQGTQQERLNQVLNYLHFS
jgi:nicotinamide riboside kinase